jgi:hypothetical protein
MNELYLYYIIDGPFVKGRKIVTVVGIFDETRDHVRGRILSSRKEKYVGTSWVITKDELTQRIQSGRCEVTLMNPVKTMRDLKKDMSE